MTCHKFIFFCIFPCFSIAIQTKKEFLQQYKDLQPIKFQLQIYQLSQQLAVKISPIMKPCKFKEIRKSIINHKQGPQNDFSPNKSPLRRNLFGQPSDVEMSFKSIKQSTMSPLKQIDQNISQISTNKKNKFCFEESAEKKNLSPLSNKKRLQEMEKSKGMFIYDSQRKAMNYQRITSNFGSDQKSNEKSSIYLNRQNKENTPVQGSTLQFTHKQRKLNTTRTNTNDIFFRPDTFSNPMYETSKNPAPGSLNKKNSSGMLFKTALQTSNKKKTLRNNGDSDRSSTGRQSSIGKLKEKLFGMKKIISEKENRPSNQPTNIQSEQTKSFTIYTIKNSTDEKSQGERLSIIAGTRKQIVEKNDDQGSFSNLVVASINKGLLKAPFKHFLNVQARQDPIQSSFLMSLNNSRVDSVNISVSESCDSILDMSPNL